MFEFRTDVATLQPAQRLADGRLVAEALITKPGVFEYADSKYPGGIRRELRPDSEVYSRPTMDSFANMPATSGHPPMLLNAGNAKQFMIGATGDKVTREPIVGESDHLKTKMMIADRATIKRMDDGDTAVSCGYACRIDETPGVDAKYGRYDVVQRDIRGNHLAVAIPAGRAGRLARVRMDAEITDEERAALASNKFGNNTTDLKTKSDARGDAVDHHQGGGAMDPEKLKEANRTLEAGLKEAETKMTAEKTRADTAASALDVATGRVDQLEKEVAALTLQIASNQTAIEAVAVAREKARADAAEAQVARFDEVRRAEVSERCSLMIDAKAIMGGDFRMDDLTNRQIKCAVVKRLDSTADVTDGVPEGMITGQFVQLIKRNLARVRQDANVAEILGTTNDQKRLDSKAQKLTDYREQWKRPLSELVGKKGA